MAKSRVAVSNEQKAALREYRRQHPYRNGKQIAQWFEERFNHKINESQVSKYCSQRFSKVEEPARATAVQRIRASKWPELEIALSQWSYRMELKKATVTGDLLKTQAERFWQTLACYQGKEMPQFSNGWLHGFKLRYGIKKHKRYGEAGAVNLEQLEKDMVSY